MDSSTIRKSIANWNAIRTNSAKLLYYFDQGNSFSYDYTSYPQVSEHVHAYPGIYENRLYFFLIPAAYDKQQYSSTIALYTKVCPVGWSVQGSDRITAAVAKSRIKAWKDHYHTWVPQDAATPIGIFQAFVIPVQDFESQTSYLTLGLEQKAAATMGLEADLIIANADGQVTVYDDFVKPVPPFGINECAEENFFLLP